MRPADGETVWFVTPRPSDRISDMSVDGVVFLQRS